ncbi:MAG: hypothetical protein SFU98_19795 [Leptospiraceae bacterium]|nr:hypothetical protein [Leptospiraceae bacterium]
MRFLFCFLFLFSFQQFSQEVLDDNTLKKIEKKWDIGEETFVPKLDKPNDFKISGPIFLSAFLPERQEFPINPSMDTTITGKYGTKITIPSNSIALPINFKKGDILTFKLEELVNDLEFISSGIHLNYFDKDRNYYLLETGGMFRISCEYYNKPLRLKRGARLKVEFPMISKEPMNLYKMSQSNEWIEKAVTNQPSNRVESEGVSIEKLFSYSDIIDDFTWWNFDKPNPEISCIAGKIESEDFQPPFTAVLLGLDVIGATFSYNIDKLDFKMNAWANKKVKLIVVDAMGNISIPNEFQTRKEQMFVTSKYDDVTKCMNAPKVVIKRNSNSVRKSREELLKFLGITDRVKPSTN